MNLNLQQPAQKKTRLVQPEQALHKQSRLPFIIETNAINDWLDAIELKQPVQATNEVYIVLKILFKHQDEFHNHFTELLPLITPVIIELCQHLEHLFCTSEKELDEKKRKIARLSTSTLRYLAILYQHLNHCHDTDTQLALNLNSCLQVSYLCLKQCALIYERPSSELWKIIGKIYQLASEKNVLKVNIKDSEPTFKNQTSITESIKTILLFSLCKPYYLSQFDILRLTPLLDQHKDKLTLTNQQSDSCMHSWNYNSSHAVQAITPGTDIGFSTLFLDSHLLVPVLISENFCSITELLTVNQSLISDLTKTKALKNRISTGFNSVIGALEQLKQNEQINKTSEHVLSITDQFELIPFDYEKKLKKAPTENTLQNDNTPCLITEAIIKEKVDLDFVLIEVASISNNAGDLVIILGDEKKTQLGIIRSITSLKNDRYQLLAEKISTEVSLVTLINHKRESKALLCKTPDNSTLLLVPPDKFTTGSNVQIEQRSFTLTRLFENTEYFMLYQIQAY